MPGDWCWVWLGKGNVLVCIFRKCVFPVLSGFNSGTKIELVTGTNLIVVRVTSFEVIRAAFSPLIHSGVFNTLLILATLHNKVPCDML